MKVVFVFWLNSLGLVLVLTQTRQPYFAPFTPDCRLTRGGSEYAGPLNVTLSGHSCQRWTSDQPHVNYYKETNFYPEGSASAAGNKCRNPDSGWNEGVWCYTTSPNKRWEHCDVAFCECRLQSDQLGVRYEGQTSVTRGGRRCRSWTSQSPKSHPFNESIFYPDTSIAMARNFCRNPNASRPDGPWCYTNDANVEWEYCLIPVCNFTSPVFPTRPQNSTTSSQTSPAQTRTSTARTTPSSTSDTRSMQPSPTNPRTIPTSTSNLRTIPTSTSNLRTIPTSTSNLRTIPTSTSNLRTIQTRTSPSATSRSPSTKLSTRTVGRPTQLPQESTNSRRENTSNNIVKIAIPIIAVIAIICIIVAIIIWKRNGLIQSSWKGFSDGQSPPGLPIGERDQQRTTTASVTVATTPRQIGSFDNPLYASEHQPIEITGVTMDHSSTDGVTITDSGVAYTPMDNVRLS